MHKWIKVSIALLAFLITVPSLCLYFFIQGQLDELVTEPAPEGMSKLMFSKFNSMGISAKDVIIHEKNDLIENFSGHKVYNHFKYNGESEKLESNGYFIYWVSHIKESQKMEVSNKTSSTALNAAIMLSDNIKEYSIGNLTIDGKESKDSIVSKSSHCLLNTCRVAFYLDIPKSKNEVEAVISIKNFKDYTLKIEKPLPSNESRIHQIASRDLGYELSSYNDEINKKTGFEYGYKRTIKKPEQTTRTTRIDSNSLSDSIFTEYLNPAEYPGEHVWNTLYMLPDMNTSILYELNNEKIINQ